MSIETVIKCDMCKSERGEANHWFESVEKAGNVAFAPFKGRKGAIQICGQKCAHALLDRWLATGSLAAETSNPVTAPVR